MSWPLITDFTPLLTKPAMALANPRWKRCVVQTNQFGQPIPRSGNFATVFKAYTEDGNGPPVALRVFTRRVPERHERYELVSDYFGNARPPCLVEFTYEEKGIRSARDGRWYPLVVMDWIEGPNLFDWTQDRCLGRDCEQLQAQADEWFAVVDRLSSADIAHGDLQHANILVAADGSLKLVDYDCVYVPPLAGRKNLEVGIPPYQHPSRNEATLLSGDLHRFSALFVYVALRVLAAWPDLWDEHVQRNGYDKLLFRPTDLREPDRSTLCRQLTGSQDSQLRYLAETLLQAYHNDAANVPPLRAVVEHFHGPLDPYRQWLGIESVDGRISQHDLLGIGLHEHDPAEIRSAAERRFEQVIAHVDSRTRDVACRLAREINDAQLALLRDDLRHRIDAPISSGVLRSNLAAAPTSPVSQNAQRQVVCSSCQASLRVPATMRQSSVRCPRCGHLISLQRA